MLDIREAAKKEILIAAHRGSTSGLIPCNTLEAFDAALYDGADVIELDVTRSRDGELFVFHPGMELPHLNQDIHLENMNAADIRKLKYVTEDHLPTPYGISTLSEVLQHLSGRCYINLDHCWDYIPETAAAVRRSGIEEQCFLKTWNEPQWYDVIERYAPDLQYMVMTREQDLETEHLLKRNINYIGAEVMFSDENTPLTTETYIQSMHDRGLILWCDGIVFDANVVFGAGHSDVESMLGHPENGWGWMADHGYDILQTDWTGSAVRYLWDSGKKQKKQE